MQSALMWLEPVEVLLNSFLCSENLKASNFETINADGRNKRDPKLTLCLLYMFRYYNKYIEGQNKLDKTTQGSMRTGSEKKHKDKATDGKHDEETKRKHRVEKGKSI